MTDTLQSSHRPFVMIYDEARNLIIGDTSKDAPSPAMTTAVYLALLSRANSRTGSCYPSISRLSKESGVSTRTVHAAIDTLIRLGLLQRERRFSDDGSQTSSVYTVHHQSCISAPPSASPAPPPLQVAHTPPAGDADKLDEEELDPTLEPDPPTEVLQKKITPYQLFEVMCETQGHDPLDITAGEKGRQLKTAKQLVEAGMSEQDVRDETRWLLGQSWLQSGVDMPLLAKMHFKWKASLSRAAAPSANVTPFPASSTKTSRSVAAIFRASEMLDRHEQARYQIGGGA